MHVYVFIKIKYIFNVLKKIETKILNDSVGQRNSQPADAVFTHVRYIGALS